MTAMEIMFKLLAKYDDEKIKEDAEFYHYLIEAEKFAYGLRADMGDAIFSNESLSLAKNLTGM